MDVKDAAVRERIRDLQNPRPGEKRGINMLRSAARAAPRSDGRIPAAEEEPRDCLRASRFKVYNAAEPQQGAGVQHAVG